ncbi:hypothetical protein BDC45DRAFT_278391 [Circinella umbellata]|nr:hypothetical protein BDC45DRAFT_278391 [Circinella umbellata]
MSQAERLEHLYRSHGSDNHLDLMTAKWSKRKHDIIKEYLKALKFEYAVTNEEAGCLAKLRCCKNREDLVSLKTDLFKHREVSAGIEFIRTAIHHIILFWKNNKNVLNNLEDWWRIFLYGPVFDSAFSSAQEYNIIRSESESQAYKAYCILFKDVLPPGEKQKMDKVDMIVRTADHQFDIFSAEDKPLSATRKSVQDMIAKNQARRVITLDVIEKQLPRPELISYFENFTAIWHGNLMRLHCTRKINGRFYHYEAASTHVPLSPENYEGIARLLLIVLSLKV